MRKKIYYTICIILCLGFALSVLKPDKNKKILEEIVSEWNSRKIILPDTIIYYKYGIELVNFNDSSSYKILCYTNRDGCMSCKLKLSDWKQFINKLNSLPYKVPIIFVMNTDNIMDLRKLLRDENFSYPILIDTKDYVNTINRFPTNPRFQTFLLNQKNEVILIGNPVYSQAIEDLYLTFLKEKAFNINH